MLKLLSMKEKSVLDKGENFMDRRKYSLKTLIVDNNVDYLEYAREVLNDIVTGDIYIALDGKRAFEIFEEPRDILKRIPGLEYVDMARNRLQARCCGGGGGVQANNPEMAVDMATERVRDALAVGAEIIVSGCAACKDNLRKGSKAIPKKERGKIKIMDITEMVSNAMGS